MQEGALVIAAGTASSDSEQVVSFRIGGEVMAINVGIVSEIVRIREITEVPQVPIFVQGVMNLRGHIIPVLNLRCRLGMPPAENTRSTRIVVVDVEGESVGMVVDGVEEVVTFSTAEIAPPSPVLVSVNTDFVRGIARREGTLIILLDVERVVSTGRSEEGAAALPAGGPLRSLPAAGGSDAQ
jgi:purine-binding chemotaxis protein CheW